jgi:predicted MPP superfamily phosphohydrolase
MPIGILVFLVLFLGTWGTMHWYVYHNLAKLGWDRGWLIAILWALALAFPLARLLAFRWRPAGLRVLYWIGAVWMGSVFLFSFWFLVASLVRRILGLAGVDASGDPKAWIGGVAAAVAAMVAWGALNAARGPRDVHYKVDRKARYGGGRKARIVQISDVHLGLILGADWLRGIVDRINKLDPDLVLITGDLFDPEFPDDAGAVAQLSRLKGKQGVFAVSGNHEFYSGMQRYFRMMEDARIPVLDSEVRVTSGGLQVCGLHDHTADRFTGAGVTRDLGKALDGIDPAKPSILMAHQPKGLEPATNARIDVIFSGHTHAGQIFPFWMLVRMQFRYMAGRYRLGPDTELIVNTGTGFWGPPMRLGTDSQIVVADLEY